jgi:hypothetical protein
VSEDNSHCGPGVTLEQKNSAGPQGGPADDAPKVIFWSPVGIDW